MSKVKNLTKQEIMDSVEEISKSSFVFSRRKIKKQIYTLYKNNSIPNMDQVVSMVLVSISILNANLINMIAEIYKGSTGYDIDISKILKHHTNSMNELFMKDELKKDKKLN